MAFSDHFLESLLSMTLGGVQLPQQPKLIGVRMSEETRSWLGIAHFEAIARTVPIVIDNSLGRFVRMTFEGGEDVCVPLEEAFAGTWHGRRESIRYRTHSKIGNRLIKLRLELGIRTATAAFRLGLTEWEYRALEFDRASASFEEIEKILRGDV